MLTTIIFILIWLILGYVGYFIISIVNRNEFDFNIRDIEDNKYFLIMLGLISLIISFAYLLETKTK